MAKGVSPAQVAFARLGIKKTKGYELIAQGKLVARKMGSLTVVTDESIDALIESLPPFISRAKIGTLQHLAKGEKSAHADGPASPLATSTSAALKRKNASPTSVTRERLKAKHHKFPHTAAT